MTNGEVRNRLFWLKNELNLDVYYQVKLVRTNWMLVNRVNCHLEGQHRNKWIGYTILVDAEDNGTFTVRCYYNKVDTEYLVCLLKKCDCTVENVHYWMKQFYSACRIINRTLDHQPETVHEITESEIYDRCCKKLQYIANQERAGVDVQHEKVASL